MKSVIEIVMSTMSSSISYRLTSTTGLMSGAKYNSIATVFLI